MKIKGKLGTKEVIVLIDCGATHNFLSMELIEELKLPLLTIANYGVVMGTRMAIRGKGICKGVIIEMQGLTVVEDFLPLSLESRDVILGMQWLGTLGSMEVNWRNLVMKFSMGDTLMTLGGIQVYVILGIIKNYNEGSATTGQRSNSGIELLTYLG